MHGRLMISVPQTEATAVWLRECLPPQRGEQIQAAFSQPAVDLVGFGGSKGNDTDPGTTSFHFVCVDLEKALAEFLEVGQRLSFPPGTRLVYIAPNWGSSSRIVATW